MLTIILILVVEVEAEVENHRLDLFDVLQKLREKEITIITTITISSMSSTVKSTCSISLLPNLDFQRQTKILLETHSIVLRPKMILTLAPLSTTQSLLSSTSARSTRITYGTSLSKTVSKMNAQSSASNFSINSDLKKPQVSQRSKECAILLRI